MWTLPHNAVAQSDLDAAIQAIEQSFFQATAAAIACSDETRRVLFRDMQQSLIGHLKRIVEPVADPQFQDFVDLYHIVSPFDDDDDDDEQPASVVEVDDEEEEIDEADLLDSKALAEARKLRSSVRDLSRSVQEIRERVLKDSLETSSDQEYNALLEELENNRSSMNGNTNTNQMAVDSQRVVLEESLQALSALLNDSQWSMLPEQLESLQSTIDVIHKNTDKSQPMSQTEVAIISRANSADEENDWEMVLSQESPSGSHGGLMTASDRLARFFELLE